MMHKNNKVLIFGGGFLGAQIWRYLINGGINTTLTSRSLKSNVVQKIVNLMNAKEVEDAIDNIKPSCIILAAFDFSNSIDANLAMINNIILSKSFKRINPQLVYFSSCAEYGSLKDSCGSFNETDPQNPISKYGETKSLITNYLVENIELLTILRIFNPYSRKAPKTLYVGKLWSELSKANAKKVFEIDCANDVRDYFNLELLNSVIMGVILRESNFGILNIASGKGCSILYLTQKIIREFGIDLFDIKINKSKLHSKLPYSIGSTAKLQSLGFNIQDLVL